MGDSSSQYVLCTAAVQGLFPVGFVGPLISINGCVEWPSTEIVESFWLMKKLVDSKNTD